VTLSSSFQTRCEKVNPAFSQALTAILFAGWWNIFPTVDFNPH